MSHIYDSPRAGSPGSPDFVSSPPYQTQEGLTEQSPPSSLPPKEHKPGNENRVSSHSDTSNTIVNTPVKKRRRRVKKKRRKVPTDEAAAGIAAHVGNAASKDISTMVNATNPAVMPSGRVSPAPGGASNADLEANNELKNEKRLFSFLFSRKVPPISSPEERTTYPWKSANPFSKLVFHWMLPIMVKGYKRTLTPDDLWFLTPELTVEDMHMRYTSYLSDILQKSKDKYLRKNSTLDGWEWPMTAVPWALYYTFFWQYTLSCIWLALAFTAQSLSPLLTKRLIDFVELRAYGVEKTYNKGVGYTIGSVVLVFVNGMLLNHCFHLAMMAGAQVKAILTKDLLLKSFKLSERSRSKFSNGRITSIMSTDLARIDLALGFQPFVVCFPIPVIIAIILLVMQIGVSSLTGIGLFVVSFFICVFLTKILYDTRETVVKTTDKRISMMREILNNIKVIKFYAWEYAYRLNIIKLREEEMKYLFTIKVLRNFITAYAVTLPTLTSMISFVTMWKTNSMKSAGVVFSSLSLYSILAQAIMLLPIALATGADAYVGFKRCTRFLSASEFDDDLNERMDEDNDNYYIGDDTNSEFQFKSDDTEFAQNAFPTLDTNGRDVEDDTALKVTNANFTWHSFHDDADAENDESSLWDTESRKSKEKKAKSNVKERHFSVGEFSKDSRSSNDTYYEKGHVRYKPDVASVDSSGLGNAFPGLVDINLDIKRGEFVVVTGVIGSGKSSLLAALSGFMKLSNPARGTLTVNDDLLFCSSPWIQNTSVRENILFGKPFDYARYNLIIKACCLLEDLAVLPAGDRTEIGERGVTLSGGQKARINLARACYSNSNVLLFDDVLSAVDSRVGRTIVDELFCGYIKEKTRVLATHQLSLVDRADKIVFLNGDGTIDVGSAQELEQRNPRFRRLVQFNTETVSIEEELVDGPMDHALVKPVASEEEYSDDKRNTIMTADEDRATNAIGWGVYWKYIQLGSGIFGWSALPLYVLIMAFSTFFQLFTNTWLSYWTEKKYANISDNIYVAVYVAFAFVTVIVTGVQFTMLGYMNNKSAEMLNIKAVERVLHAPMSFIDSNPLGRILNRFTKDTDALDNEIGEQLRLFLFPAALIIGIIILCVCYLPWFAIAVPFLALAFVFITNFYQGSSREVKRLEALQRSMVYNNFNETLTGMATIRAYKVEQNFIDKNDYYVDKMNEAYYISIANQRWLSVQLDIIAASFAMIICLLCITDQFHISASSTGLLLNYVIQIVGLLSLTVRTMTQVENEMNSVERLHSYAFKMPQEAAYERPEKAPAPEWPPSGYIQFNNVSLKYRENLPLVLEDLSFGAYPGEKVGICGRTGAGKSSIMVALYRLTELERGSITIDGIDTRELGLHDLRSRLSIIPQDPVLFQGTIRKNLDPFKQYSDDLLWDSMRRSGLLDALTLAKIRNTKFVKDSTRYDELHKFHLDQLVEDDGSNFSLGERQLIALARSLVRNSKILILDEATSSVDYETDHKIQNTITNEFAKCTILCIAHRLKTILQYDRILVMDKGKIVEKGTPMALYRKNGMFRQMCEKANINESDF